MAPSSNIFSVQGRGLKLDTRADIEPLLLEVDPALIEEIHFGGNTIGVDASHALAEFLAKTRVLKVADFADIFTGRLITEIPQALTAICDALIDKTSLVEINLSDNAFGGRSVDPIVPFLTHNRSFQILKLNNNGLGPLGGEVIANALLESAKLSAAEGKQSSLRTVICGRNRLEDGSAAAWAAAFAAHATLTEVRMPQNGIRMDGITALAQGLAKCTGLQHIDLQDNTFTEDGKLTGVQTWADSLASWPDLGFLNLSDCVLSTHGEVPALLETLVSGSNSKLHTLQLQNNNLAAETFALLAKLVPAGLPGLKSLEVQWNDQKEDDVNIDTLASILKQRGGKLIATDEDEEDEEEEDEVLPVDEAPEEPPAAKPTTKNSVDELADLLGKAEIR